jgi:hypothetical protein
MVANQSRPGFVWSSAANDWVPIAGVLDVNRSYDFNAASTIGGNTIINNTMPISGFRNVIINGGFKIDQRNNGASQTITSTNAYTADRWYANAAGANVTGARIAGAIPSQYYYRVTGATSNTQVSIAQRIEASNSYHLAGQTVTLSVKLASSSLTSITWALGYATATDNFAGITPGPSGTFTINSTLTTYSATFTVPAEATTGLRFLLQTSSGLVASQTLTIADVQLEPGSAATPFENRPIGTELALCQRYFFSIPLPATTCAFAFGYVQTGTTNRYFVSTPVSMRTVTSVAETYTTMNSVGGSNQALTLSSTPVTTTSNGVVIEGTVATAQTAPLVIFANNGTFTADAEL